MTETALRCRACGSKVRATWLRCPACRELLHGGKLDAAQPPERRNRVGAVVLTGVLAVGLAVWGLSLGRTAAPATAPSQGIDPAELAASEASPTARPTAAGSGGMAPEWDAADAGASGTAAYRQGDMNSALAAYERATELNPDDVTARANLAQVLVRVGRVAEALPHLDFVLAQRPNEWAARFNRARAYALLERWDDARVDYQAAAAAFPDDHVTLFNLGLVHRKTNDHAAAAAAFERVLAVAPDGVEVLIPLAQEYQALNRVDDARGMFQRYLAQRSDGAEADKVRAALAALAAK